MARWPRKQTHVSLPEARLSARRARSAKRQARGSRRPTTSGILRAAERVFAREGYADTSLRRLIAAAGVSTTAFYARFDSKEAVLDALIVELFRKLYEAAVAELSQSKSLEEGFDRGVDVLVTVFSNKKSLVRLALTEASCSPTSRKTIQNSYGILARLLADSLGRLEARGAIELPDAEAFGWALVGAMHMHVVRWAVYDELDDAALAHALRTSARSMLPAVTPRESKAAPPRAARQR